MEKRNKIYKMMGMMSGTSLDGIDLSLACYSKNETNWVYQSIMCKTFPYNQQDILLLKSMENHQLSYLEFREKEI
jgi:1,6-anhydro-N-acetylmuramate kinase